MLAGFSHTSPIDLRVAFGEERKQGESEAATVRKFGGRAERDAFALSLPGAKGIGHQAIKGV